MATTTFTRNLGLRVDSNLTSSAKYNLQRIDSAIGENANLFLASDSNAVVRSKVDIVLQPQSADIGGSGIGGSVSIGLPAQPIQSLEVSATELNLSGSLGLRDTAGPFSAYLRYNSALTGPGPEATADRYLSLDLQGADRGITLGGNLVLGASLTTATAAITLTADPSGSSVILPSIGILATLSGSETLSNKILSAPVITGGTSSGLTATSASISSSSISASTITGSTLSGSSIDGSPIGQSTPALGTFSGLSVTGSASIGGSQILTATNSVVVQNKSMSGSDNSFSAIPYSALVLSNSVVNGDISSSAAIAYSKLALTNSLVDSDISTSAAIQGTKILPDFGSNVLQTSGGYRVNQSGNFILLAPPASLLASYTLQLPDSSGSAGQVVTKGAGNSLVWSSPVTSALLENNVDIGSPSNSRTAVNTAVLGDIQGDVSTGLTIKAGVVTDSDINSSASIALSKLASLTSNRAIVSSSGGILSPSAVTDVELGYVSGVTSSIQTQLTGKQPVGNYITALTGDVSATGPGSVTASISDSTVTGKVLTGYTPTSGSVAATDSILQALGKLGNDQHVAVTLGSANGLSILGQQLSVALAGAGTTGTLSSTDWTTFNAKQATISVLDTSSIDVTLSGGTQISADLRLSAASPSAGNRLVALATLGDGLRAQIADTSITAANLTGLDTSSGFPITASDTVLSGLGKTQNRLLLQEFIHEDSKEPTGFVNRTDSEILFNRDTRTFTVQPKSPATQYRFWIKGTEFIKTGPDSVVIPDVTSDYFFYFDETGTLQYITTFALSLLTSEVYVSVLRWNATRKEAIIFGDERHGCVMDALTHIYLHDTRGTQYLSGLALANFPAADSPSYALLTSAQFSVADGRIADEDIFFDIINGQPQVLSTAAEIPVFYREGASGEWNNNFTNITFATSTAYTLGQKVRPLTGDQRRVMVVAVAGTTGASEPVWPTAINGTVVSGTVTFRYESDLRVPVKRFLGGAVRLAFNEFTGGSWQQTEVLNNDFALIHLFATTNIQFPIIAVQGQADYSTVGDARDGATGEINTLSLGVLPFQEYTAIATVIYETQTGAANLSGSRLRQVDTATASWYVRWTGQNISPSSSPANHGSLAGLTTGDAGHSQFALLAGRTGGQILRGGLNASENLTLQSTVSGTRGEIVAADPVRIQNQSPLRLQELTSNGTDFIGLRAPASVTSSVTLTLPDGAGVSGQQLTTDGVGTLSWSSPVANKYTAALSWSGVGPYTMSISAATHGRGTAPVVTIQETIGGPFVENVLVDQILVDSSTGNLTITSSTNFAGRVIII